MDRAKLARLIEEAKESLKLMEQWAEDETRDSDRVTSQRLITALRINKQLESLSLRSSVILHIVLAATDQ